MSISDIDHVQLAAPPNCEVQARHFFGRLLGLEEIEKPESLRSRGGCWFKLGSIQLHIGVEGDFRPAKKAHLAFVVHQVDVLAAKLERAGVRCTWDRAIDSVHRFYADDPWGNRLEFVERNASPCLREAGRRVAQPGETTEADAPPSVAPRGVGGTVNPAYDYLYLGLTPECDCQFMTPGEHFVHKLGERDTRRFRGRVIGLL
jgi:catechol 2,3-dioxygenase-like lactoylglutathione lyase family enzyme